MAITNDVSLYRPHLPLGHQTWDPSGSAALPTSDLEPLGPPLDIRPRTHPPTTDIWWQTLETC